MEDIYSRFNTLTQKVNSLELLTGTIGTSQAAIAQIYSRLDTFAETTNSNFAQISQRFDCVETVQAEHSQQFAEILRILRDRNGGSGL
ncbi:hypothetical protein [Nostoc sp.]|uniref:hypothetical protein n=1 Tax=Nostoc sp. TaxID=1180 RepID=UPI002FFAF7A4